MSLSHPQNSKPASSSRRAEGKGLTRSTWGRPPRMSGIRIGSNVHFWCGADLVDRTCPKLRPLRSYPRPPSGVGILDLLTGRKQSPHPEKYIRGCHPLLAGRLLRRSLSFDISRTIDRAPNSRLWRHRRSSCLAHVQSNRPGREAAFPRSQRPGTILLTFECEPTLARLH